MFTRKIGRAVAGAALVASVAFAPAVRAAEGETKSSAPSAQKMPSTPYRMYKTDPMQMYKMMDADNKGYVTKEEFMKFQEQLFDKWDKAKQGRLTAPQFTDHG
jgi:hypothetical protein